jgi:hypothetical protein
LVVSEVFSPDTKITVTGGTREVGAQPKGLPGNKQGPEICSEVFYTRPKDKDEVTEGRKDVWYSNAAERSTQKQTARKSGKMVIPENRISYLLNPPNKVNLPLSLTVEF